jgi:hypothetical protein
VIDLCFIASLLDFASASCTRRAALSEVVEGTKGADRPERLRSLSICRGVALNMLTLSEPIAAVSAEG